jgi:hypothetical protein
LVAVGLAVVVAVASLVVAYPFLEEEYFGPAPVWHPFSGVFDGSGQLASEGCSLKDLQPVLAGVGGIDRVTATSVVVCSFHGTSYVGYYGTDCNLNPTGPIPSINGSQIPFDGCVLSTAPLNYTFTGIFNLDAKSNNSIQIYSAQRIIANMTPAQSWKTYGCSLKTDNMTKSNEPLACRYMGVVYLASDVLQTCNLGTPIQVYGVPIPSGSCNLERSETVSG